MTIVVHVTLNTSTDIDTSMLSVLKSSKYHLFRDSGTEQWKLIQMRLTSEGSAFIILSPREFPLWSSLYVEVKKDKIVFGKYNGIDAEETSSEPADMTGVLDLWFYFENMFVYIGKQGIKTIAPETIVTFFSKQLPETNHLGFSNIGLGEWVLHEGQ